MNDITCGDESPMTVVVKKECVSSDDDDDDAMDSCGNAFMCEICSVTDDESLAVFKERDDLVLHTFKNHTSTCIGCFENFHSPDDLMKHVMVENHGLPFCRECRRLFPDQRLMIRHHCQITSANEEESSEESEDDEPIVKLEPQSEDEESEFVCSSEESSSDESEAPSRPDENDLSCIHCTAEGFRNQQFLQIHTYQAHPLVCLVCFEGFDDETSLQSHQKALNHTIWNCAKCKKYFMRRTYYRMHITLNHPEDCSFKCTECDWKGMSRHQMTNHRGRVHANPMVKPEIQQNWQIYNNRCNICLKTYMTGYSLLLHTFKKHNAPGQTHVYKCELCQLGFGRARGFELHLKEYHANDMDYLTEAKTLVESTLAKSLYCEVCGELQTNYSTLQRHIRTYHPQLRPHKCNICGTGYPKQSDVQVHVWSEHEGPPAIVCPVCDHSTSNRRHLETHLKNRHGYKGMPYVYCFAHNRGFHRFAAYYKHFERVHLDPADRPVRVPGPTTGYPCHLCPKEFGSAGRIRNHILKVHEAKEKLKCDVCGNLFKNHHILIAHKRKHTDDFKCKICDKTFEMQCHLDRHQVVHSGERPYQCDICGLKLSQKSALKRHVDVVHATGKPFKSLKSRKSRGPRHEEQSRKNQEKKINDNQINDVKNRSDEFQKGETGDAEDETVKKTCKRGRKRRKDSKSPPGKLPEATTPPPKRKRGRPRKSTTKDEDQHIKVDVKVNPRGRPRKRKAKAKAEKQLYQQVSSDDDHIVSDDDDFLPSEHDSAENE